MINAVMIYYIVKPGHVFPLLQVKYSGAFEPYLVLLSKTAPTYDERLLERMGDKIAYGLEILARGYVKSTIHKQLE